MECEGAIYIFFTGYAKRREEAKDGKSWARLIFTSMIKDAEAKRDQLISLDRSAGQKEKSLAGVGRREESRHSSKTRGYEPRYRGE